LYIIDILMFISYINKKSGKSRKYYLCDGEIGGIFPSTCQLAEKRDRRRGECGGLYKLKEKWQSGRMRRS
jgi:hypothetical protein